MHRRIAEITFKPLQLAEIKEKMLNWSSRFGISLFLDSNEYEDRHGRYECLMGAGAHTLLIADDAAAFRQLESFHEQHKDWLFGHLCYDLKNVIEPALESKHERRHGWRLMQFFVPEVVCMIERGRNVMRVEALVGDAMEIAREIVQEMAMVEAEARHSLRFLSRLTREDYLQRIAVLREHIRNGDCYEINFCNEAYAEEVFLDPRQVFKRLNRTSKAPFAAYYQDEERALMCSSPERFMVKSGSVLRSQPIKGTARRGDSEAEDTASKAGLYGNEKERAENVMITDLVRNDLARSCKAGSVVVEELFGIYSFPQVHQMISTISGTLRDDTAFAEAIRYAFPMGSMTGAPKHKVMQLIEQYEVSRRELFSGSVGYITPDGDFDFNVVIRSLFYNSEKRYLSYQTGGAITWGSEAEQEWKEVRLKAGAMEQIFA